LTSADRMTKRGILRGKQQQSEAVIWCRGRRL